jgi:hypothetical protein
MSLQRRKVCQELIQETVDFRTDAVGCPLLLERSLPAGDDVVSINLIVRDRDLIRY